MLYYVHCYKLPYSSHFSSDLEKKLNRYRLNFYIENQDCIQKRTVFPK